MTSLKSYKTHCCAAKRERWYNRVSTVMCVITASVLLHACGTNNESQAKIKDSSVGTPKTAVIAVQKGMLTTSLQIPGELIAFQQVEIYAKENSFVKKLYVDVGSEVSTGQLMASMEAPELNSQISAASSRLKSQEAIYIASNASYERLLETSKTPGTIAPNDLDMSLAKKKFRVCTITGGKSGIRWSGDH